MASEAGAGAQIAAEIVRAARSGASIAVATVISAPEDSRARSGDKVLIRLDGSRIGALGGSSLEEAIVGDARLALTAFPRTQTESLYYRAEGERIHRLEAKDADDVYEVMIEVIEPPATLLIVGGGHIGLSLATIGQSCGFSVAVLDDRTMFANEERFPMADKVMAGDVRDHLDNFPIGAGTYVVMVSRGHKVDEEALRHTVARGAAYVGMIGSKRRVSTVLRHLAEEGIAVGPLEAVYTPIGLNIGAETPEEIAVSIMAEIIMVRRGAKGGQMREGRPAIKVAAAD